MCRARLRRRSPLRSSRWRIVWPEEAGIGAQPARRAKAASLLIRPGCDQEIRTWAAASGPTPGCSSSCGASGRAGERFDLTGELALLDGQLLDAARDRTQGLERSAQLDVLVAVGPRSGESTQQLGAAKWPQLAAERLRGGDEQVAQLAETGAARVDGAFAGGHQGAQRLSFAAGARLAGMLLGEHAPRRPDRVERVGLAARAALAPQPPDLEHPLPLADQETGQAGAEGACSLDRERAPPRRVGACELKSARVAGIVRVHARLEDDATRAHLDDRERVRVAVRVDTDHVVQLICKHPTHLQPSVGGPTPVAGLGVKTASGRTVGSHAPPGRTGF